MYIYIYIYYFSRRGLLKPTQKLTGAQRLFLSGNVIDIYSYVTDLYNLRGAWQSGFPVVAHIILHRECYC